MGKKSGGPSHLERKLPCQSRLVGNPSRVKPFSVAFLRATAMSTLCPGVHPGPLNLGDGENRAQRGASKWARRLSINCDLSIRSALGGGLKASIRPKFGESAAGSVLGSCEGRR